MTKSTYDWVREDYYDSIEQNMLKLKSEIGFATQRAIEENLQDLEKSTLHMSLWDKLKSRGKK